MMRGEDGDRLRRESRGGRAEEGERIGDNRRWVKGGLDDSVTEGKEVAAEIGLGNVVSRSSKSSAFHIEASLGVPNDVLRRLETYDVGTGKLSPGAEVGQFMVVLIEIGPSGGWIVEYILFLFLLLLFLLDTDEVAQDARFDGCYRRRLELRVGFIFFRQHLAIARPKLSPAPSMQSPCFLEFGGPHGNFLCIHPGLSKAQSAKHGDRGGRTAEAGRVGRRPIEDEGSWYREAETKLKRRPSGGVGRVEWGRVDMDAGDIGKRGVPGPCRRGWRPREGR